MNTTQRFLVAAALVSGSACVAQPMAETSTTEQDVKLGVPESFDFFGTAMVTGDFNCDGVDDLAVSAIREAPNGGKTTGSVFLYLGIPLLGLTPWMRIDEKDLLPLSLGDDDQFGAALASAKIDADSCSDLVIGAPGAAVKSGGNHSGVVFVLYGSTSGPRIDNSVQVIDQHGLFPGDTDSPDDRFGATLAVSGENPPLLAIGVPGETIGQIASGLVDVAEADLTKSKGQQFAKFAELEPPTLNTGANFGQSIAIADLDFDGHRDIAVGAPDWNTTPGKVFLFAGTGSGYNAPITVNEHSSLGTSIGDGFGFTLAVGAIDAPRELVIGAPGFNGNGRVFVYAPFAVNGQLAGASVDAGVTAGAGGIGQSLKVADVNGDGLADIVSGVPGHRSTSGADIGEIAIFENNNMSAFASQPLVLLQQLQWSTQLGSSDIPQTPADNDAMGASLAIGDFNNDGKIDLVGGMPTRSNQALDGTNLTDESGAIFEFFGGSEFPSATPPFTSGNGVYIDEGNG